MLFLVNFSFRRFFLSFLITQRGYSAFEKLIPLKYQNVSINIRWGDYFPFPFFRTKEKNFRHLSRFFFPFFFWETAKNDKTIYYNKIFIYIQPEGAFFAKKDECVILVNRYIVAVNLHNSSLR